MPASSRMCYALIGLSSTRASMTSMIAISLLLASWSSAPEILPLEYQGQQVYRTSHALLIADDTPPQGEAAFGNSIRELAKALVETCRFPAGNVRVLDGQTATTGNVRAELARLRDSKQVSRQDRVLIVLAAHGTLKAQVGYFMMYGKDDNLLPMQEVAHSVLSTEGIPAKHVLMLADSCHAGSIATNEPIVGADPDATLSDLFKRPYRGIWAGANAGGRAFSNDSAQRTRMLSAIVSCLASDDTYPLNVAGAADVLYKSRQYVPVTYTPIAQGAYIFALRGSKIEEGAERARQEIVRKDRGRAEALSYAHFQQVLDAEKAVASSDRTKDAKGWALAQLQLGKAYANLPTGNREENLRKAIDLFSASLGVLAQSAYPTEWAETQDAMGAAYRNLPTGDKSANLAMAIRCYEASLKVRTEQSTPEAWATTMGNLGIAYWDMQDGDRSANLAKAIECFESSLRVFTEQKSTEGWAKTMNSMGGAYAAQTAGDRPANLARAVECYQESLRYYTEADFPEQWAQTMVNMGAALSGFPLGNGEHLNRAIECYQASLRIFTERAYPEGWAATVANLAACYVSIPSGNRAANLASAIELYESTLRVYTERAFPDGWAATMGNIGACYALIASPANLAKALEHFEASLRVYNQTAYPEDWARTIGNLGKVYTSQADFAKAISCFESALQVFTPDLPWQRCETLYWMAKAVYLNGDKERAKSLLEACVEMASKGRRREFFERGNEALRSGFQS